MPEAHTRSFPDFQSRRSGPLYAFPLTFLYLFPAVALGVARAAIDAFAEIANRREITVTALGGQRVLLRSAAYALHSADQFEDRAIRILEADHADRGTVGPLDFLERCQTLDLLCLQIRVGPVDIVNGEGDAADADVVERRVGLALRRGVDELDQVEHGRVGIIAETHEDAAELFDLQAKRVADARIVKGEILHLGETQILVEAD